MSCIDHEISVLLALDDAKRAAGSRRDGLEHVVQVHAVLVCGDMVYTVMEYCAGTHETPWAANCCVSELTLVVMGDGVDGRGGFTGTHHR